MAGGTPAAGALFATTNGGATWEPRIVPAAVAGLEAVSCASTKDCVAVGTSATAGGHHRHDGRRRGLGDREGAGGALAARQRLLPVHPRTAFASGETKSGFPITLSTTNDGATWTRHKLPPSVAGVEAVSCASTKDCVAVGYTAFQSGAIAGAVATTTNGGGFWHAQTVPTDVMQLTAVSCGSTDHCVAVGALATPPTSPPAGVIIATVDGGRSWRRRERRPAGGVVHVWRFLSVGGAVRRGRRPPDGVRRDHGTAVATSNAGATWEPVGLAPEVSSLGGVSCAGPGYCQSLGTTSQSEVILGEKPTG